MAINQKRIMMKKIIYMIDDFYEAFRSKNLIVYLSMLQNPLAMHHLNILNETQEELERLGRKRFGPSYKRQRYNLLDFIL